MLTARLEEVVVDLRARGDKVDDKVDEVIDAESESA